MHRRRQENAPGHKASKERLTLIFGRNYEGLRLKLKLAYFSNDANTLRAMLKKMNECVVCWVAFESYAL